jgi:type II secretory pathway pseudopilin PulG
MLRLFFKYNNKAAMFGLDARIALAIFASLSVISGAALYKVMEQIKISQYNQFFKEIVKASEQYYLDNGSPLPQLTNTDKAYGAQLVENKDNLSTWKGPYIDSIVAASDAYTLKPELFGVAPWGNISLKTISAWGVLATTCAANSNDCAEWVRFNLNDDAEIAWGQDVFNNLDTHIDGGDGPKNGKIRYVEIAVDNQDIFYQGVVRKRPNG